MVMDKDKSIKNEKLRITDDDNRNSQLDNRNSKFVIRNSMVPKLRFPEFKDKGEWDADKLENLITTITPPKKLSSKEYFEEGEFPIIDQSHSYYCGYTNDTKAVISNDLPLIIFGDHTCIVKIATRPFVQGADGIKIIKTKNAILTQFLYQYLQYKPVKQEEYKRHFSILKNKVVLFPNNFLEQQKIAACLSSLDEVIEGHTRKLELLRGHKKGLMQNLFPNPISNEKLRITDNDNGNSQLEDRNSQFVIRNSNLPKYRFPEFKNDGEWEEKKLGDLADKEVKWSFTGGPFGSNLKAEDYTTKGIRIIQLQNIGDGEFHDEYKIYTSIEKADELLSCNIYAGEIILSKMGDPVGRACIIPDDLKRCVMASDGIRLVVDEKKYSKYFIYSLINSKTVRESIESKATGSTRKRIGLVELKNIVLLIPHSIEEQQKIASCLWALDELIEAQAAKIEQLQQHKKGLMQNLFPITK